MVKRNSKKFSGKHLRNARIKIDYSGVKPKVQFSYPSKYGNTGSMFYTILICWLFFFWLCFFIVGLYYSQADRIDYIFQSKDKKMVQCIEETKEILIKNQSRIIKSVCESAERYVIKETYLNVVSFVQNKTKMYLILVSLYLILPPFLIYFPFKRQWAKIYPKYQAMWSKKKLAMFNPKDVKLDLEGNYFCEIPVFNNIILDYTATKGFSKYLKFFEIREHKFKHVVSRFKKKLTKRGKKNRRKNMLNEYLWYAKFYFSEKPRNGRLEVIFK